MPGRSGWRSRAAALRRSGHTGLGCCRWHGKSRINCASFTRCRCAPCVGAGQGAETGGWGGLWEAQGGVVRGQGSKHGSGGKTGGCGHTKKQTCLWGMVNPGPVPGTAAVPQHRQRRDTGVRGDRGRSRAGTHPPEQPGVVGLRWALLWRRGAAAGARAGPGHGGRCATVQRTWTCLR